MTPEERVAAVIEDIGVEDKTLAAIVRSAIYGCHKQAHAEGYAEFARDFRAWLRSRDYADPDSELDCFLASRAITPNEAGP